MRLEKQQANDVVNRADQMFKFAILLGSVWTEETKVNVVPIEEISGDVVDEFTVVVSLHGQNREIKLSVHI